MNDEVDFYTNPMSRGRTVRWMLEEVGAPYRTHTLDYGTTMKAPDYLAINPMGKVPAIRHRGVVVTEVAAIVAYLADAFPQAQLAPAANDKLRGPYYRWIFFAAGPLEAALINTALGVNVPPERERMVGYGRLADAVATLEAAIGEREYLVGDTFSAADVVLGALLGWTLHFGVLEKRPAFVRFASALAARPAAQRAREMDEAETAQRS